MILQCYRRVEHQFATLERADVLERVVLVFHAEMLPQIRHTRELFETNVARHPALGTGQRNQLHVRTLGDVLHRTGLGMSVLFVLVEYAHVGEEFFADMTHHSLLAGAHRVQDSR